MLIETQVNSVPQASICDVRHILMYMLSQKVFLTLDRVADMTANNDKGRIHRKAWQKSIKNGCSHGVNIRYTAMRGKISVQKIN